MPRTNVDRRDAALPPLDPDYDPRRDPAFLEFERKGEETAASYAKAHPPKEVNAYFPTPREGVDTPGSETRTAAIIDITQRLKAAGKPHDNAAILAELQKIAHPKYVAGPHVASAKSTVEAIMRCVRERGMKALEEPKNAERLSRCGRAAKREITSRCRKLQKQGKPPS